MPGATELKVLIVDDSIIARQMLRKILEDEGVDNVQEALNGAEAIEKYKEFSPDLVFLDIIMPDMPGDKTLEEIISFDKDARIIMLSSLGTKEKVLECLKKGAENFIMKPIEKERIVEIFNKIIEAKEAD
ncbi:MAG: response regulator [Candidatus Aureabacteria bacterium]|nr:response regulator [Candidatus Auribacterota bacterium]